MKRATAWPHAPVHRLCESGTFIVTAGTYEKRHHFRGAERHGVLHRGLLAMAQKYHWQLEAWAVFSNHYHFIGHSPADAPDARNLPTMLADLHSETARWVNRLDDAEGRQVWYNYWETRLTFEASYLARLNYVHQNPVNHGLAPKAALYPWCSAGWFERTAPSSQVQTICSLKIDKLNVFDEFEPAAEW